MPDCRWCGKPTDRPTGWCSRSKSCRARDRAYKLLATLPPWERKLAALTQEWENAPAD